MKKVAFFIDGFNLYHAINDDERYKKYKWLDLNSLAKKFITHDESIT